MNVHPSPLFSLFPNPRFALLNRHGSHARFRLLRKLHIRKDGGGRHSVLVAPAQKLNVRTNHGHVGARPLARRRRRRRTVLFVTTAAAKDVEVILVKVLADHHGLVRFGLHARHVVRTERIVRFVIDVDNRIEEFLVRRDQVGL